MKNQFQLKKLLKSSQGTQGFTLVELMVVVAIIGILSAVAIPNFKQFQSKAKTSEAKLQLAAIYGVETSMQSDYDNYGTCLGYGGYEKAAKGYYIVGFTAQNATADGKVDTSIGSGTPCVTDGASNFSFVPVLRHTGGFIGGTDGVLAVANLVDPATGTPPVWEVVDLANAFIAGAVGGISSGGVIDSWSINQDKNLLHTKKGY